MVKRKTGAGKKPAKKAAGPAGKAAKPAARGVAKGAEKRAAKRGAKPVAKRGAKAAPEAPVRAKPASPARKRRVPTKAPTPEPMAVARADELDAEPDPVATAKLALGPEADAGRRPAQIPWSYGEDRVTAAAVDPDRLFVYWEVTDPAIERARAALGAAGKSAWLDLRVYDTSGRIFDGTNANSYFDHAIDRATRQWFFHVGKPTSTAFVELGLRSTEGYFARIVRSGRVDFPRREPAPWADPEWMTVRPWSGEVEERHRAPAPPPPGGPGGGGGGGGGPLGTVPPALTLREPLAIHEVVLRQLLESGWERIEWSEAADGEGWQLEGRVQWEGPRTHTTWQAGPFDYPVEIAPVQREERQERGSVYRVGNVVHVVEGPWQVVIRNLGARAEREVVGRWEIHRSWTVLGGSSLTARAEGGRPQGGSERSIGGSERSWLAGSEERMGGASERWRIGASEVAWRGASERMFAGASQWRAAGASERSHAGASEQQLGGASEGVRAYPDPSKPGREG